MGRMGEYEVSPKESSSRSRRSNDEDHVTAFHEENSKDDSEYVGYGFKEVNNLAFRLADMTKQV